MKVVVHPDYSHLSEFVRSIPDIFETQGEYIYNERNKLKIFHVDGLTLNVKSFRVPILFNRVMYTFFRKTKAQRAYDYALHLGELSVETPAPIAYIEEKRNGLLARSYFVCMHTPMSGNLRILGDPSVSFEEVRELSVEFGRYTAEIHKKGVLHVDYSPGNILYEKREDGLYHFSLIDINRMKFCEIDKEVGCRNFCRMWAKEEFFEVAARSYAQARGYDEEECVRLVRKFHDEEWRKRDRKSAIKKRLKR